MRRSSVWFVIALLWLIDTVLGFMRGNAARAWLPALITLLFAAAGFAHRQWENRQLRSRIRR